MLKDFQQTKSYLTQFYTTLVKDHPNNLQLTARFNTMLEEAENPFHSGFKKNTLSNKFLGISKDREHLRLTLSTKSPSNMSSSASNQEQSCFEYQSDSFLDTFLFGYLYTLCKGDQERKLSLINLRLTKYINNSQQQPVNKKIQNNCVGYWKKIVQITQNKLEGKWANKLSNYYMSLSKQFKQILNECTAKVAQNLSNFNDSNINEKTLKQISHQYMMSILYIRKSNQQQQYKIQNKSYSSTIQIHYNPKQQKKYRFIDKQCKTPTKSINKKISGNDLSTEKASPRFRKILTKKSEEIDWTRSQISDKFSQKGDLGVQKKSLRHVQRIIAEYHRNTERLLQLRCFKG